LRRVVLGIVVLLVGVGVFASGVYVGENSSRPDPLAKTFEPVPAASGPIYGITGNTIEPSCYVFVTNDLFFYFAPDDPSLFCVHPGSVARGRPGGGAQIPEGCAVAPNDIIYCDSAGYPPRELLDRYYRQDVLPDASDVAAYCGFFRWRCWGRRSGTPH
jgi:hypothetical protein